MKAATSETLKAPSADIASKNNKRMQEVTRKRRVKM